MLMTYGMFYLLYSKRKGPNMPNIDPWGTPQFEWLCCGLLMYDIVGIDDIFSWQDTFMYYSKR